MSENNQRRSYDRNDRSHKEKISRQQERRRRERMKKRRRNRIIIVSGAAVILAVIVLITVFAVKICTSNTRAEEPTEPTSATEPPTQAPTVKEIADNGKNGYSDSDGSMYFWDNKAFELFYGSSDSSNLYASAINGYKQKLGSDIKVYDMVVPNHSEFGLCEREAKKISADLGVTSQRSYTSSLYNNLSKDVRSVDIYNTLNSHKTEYIYLNTDHRWTALGSYYAYTDFAKAAGITPLQLRKAQKNTIDGFLGSLYTSSQDASLQNNPDYIDYYTLPGNYECKLFLQNSTDPVDVGMYNSNLKDGESPYGVFIWGDNPLTIIDNTDNNSGNKIAIVKDCYGNAFAPYLAYNYDEVHIIDYLYFNGNLADYCNKNGIKTVLFLNSITSANTSSQLTAMNSLFENSGTGSYNLDASSVSDTSEDVDVTNDTDDTQETDNSDSSDYSADYSDSDDNSGYDYSYDNSGSDDNSGYDYSYDYSDSDDNSEYGYSNDYSGSDDYYGYDYSG
ncbi:MAG: DHHW family protein [Acutalibacteraceae bacterium]